MTEPEWFVAWSRHDRRTGVVLSSGTVGPFTEHEADMESRRMRSTGARAEAYTADTLPGL